MEKLSVWFCGLYTTPCLTSLLYGYDTVSISGAIDFLQDKYALSPALQGLAISSIIIGGVIGAGFSGFLSDKYGRRRSTGRRAKAALGRACCVYWRIDHMGRLRADDPFAFRRLLTP